MIRLVNTLPLLICHAAVCRVAVGRIVSLFSVSYWLTPAYCLWYLARYLESTTLWLILAKALLNTHFLLALCILKVTNKHANLMHQVGPPCCVTPGELKPVARSFTVLELVKHQAAALADISLDLYEQRCIGLAGCWIRTRL